MRKGEKVGLKGVDCFVCLNLLGFFSLAFLPFIFLLEHMYKLRSRILFLNSSSSPECPARKASLDYRSDVGERVYELSGAAHTRQLNASTFMHNVAR